MIRKRYTKKVFSKKKNPNFVPVTGSLSISPRVLEQENSHWSIRNLTNSVNLIRNPQELSVSVSTLSSDTCFIEENCIDQGKFDTLTFNKPAFTGSAVEIKKIERNLSPTLRRSKIKKKNNDSIIGKRKKKNLNKEVNKQQRPESSQESTPHLYTDYTQRLHNILLLNTSSSDSDDN
jgi:hypothetical protein